MYARVEMFHFQKNLKVLIRFLGANEAPLHLSYLKELVIQLHTNGPAIWKRQMK